MERISKCRKAISKWSKDQYLNSKKAIDDLKFRLDSELSKTSADEPVISSLNFALLQAYRAEEEYWRQRSRQQWLSLGDRNTGYFHASARGRRARNRLAVLEATDGTLVYEEDQIASVIADYFASIFTASTHDCVNTVQSALNPKVTAAQNEMLIEIPSASEIKKALFSIHPDKAPGPDGFSASFFQTNWETTGPAIIREIQNFFQHGSLPQSLNSTHIRLIPKIPSPKLVSDYRPIALCNVYYKVISKLLSLRLKPLLHSIISENQSAFVPGRAISDNVLITHEILHYLKTTKSRKRCSMAVKTDMSKAYDRLEWRFIKCVLATLGFHDNFITWILECITTVSYSFLVNDAVLGCVQPERGIRQGDPLSPYIFILCSEVLSGLCSKAQREGKLPGIKIAKNSPSINHLLFADDTMFFIPTDHRSCTTLKNILQLYEEASGQRINTDKSSLSFAARTSSRLRNEVKRTLEITKEGGVGKYLGLPEHFGRRKKDLFHSIVNRIKIKAASLSTRFLSSAGKLTLLKAVLSAIPSYAMTCFLLPVGICNLIQSVLTRFWWDSNTGKKKMCWLSWDKLTKPKGMGGLGFKDIQTFNIALLAKLPWRMLTNPNCLLARVLLGKYCHKASLLNVQLVKGAFHGWTSILAGRDLLKQHLGRAVGDGTEIKVWNEPWISTSISVVPNGPLREGDSDMFVSDLITRGSCEWNKELINKILPDFTDEILKLKPSKMGAQDSYIWYPASSGIYSTKSGYAAAVAVQEPDNSSTSIPSAFNWYKSVWSVPTAPKIQLFVWKAINGALPTGENLQKRGLLQNTTCIHCGLTETTEHLLLHCVFAKQVWEHIPLASPIDPDDFPSFPSAVDAATSWVCLPPSGVSGDIFSWVVWHLWITRNQLVFEARPISAKATALKAVMSAREWTQAQEPPSKAMKNNQIQGRPDSFPTGTIACNTDAAWRKESSEAGLAWIFDSSTAPNVSNGCKFQPGVASVLMAEGLAVREALSHALHTGISKIWLRSDSLSLINAINSISKPMDLYGVLSDIERLSVSFEFCCFSFVAREENGPADSLSKACLYHSITSWA